MHWTTTALTTDIWIGYNAQRMYTNVNSFKTTALLMDTYANTLGKSLTTNAL